MASIYHDIATRTNGNIYIGVVGPVRTGKSTFIRKTIEHLVLTQIDDVYLRDRTIDELPQASAGKTIMTTEPKFVPENGIRVSLGDNTSFNIRMVDCVGFVINGALGQNEDDMPRMVRTPWDENEIPFEKAAELGTQKVIREHSTIGVVVTTDGSIGEIPRADYIEAERKVIEEMKKTGKPFVVILNSMFPSAEQTDHIRDGMEREFGVPVLVKNCAELTREDVDEILMSVLKEFPISRICVDLPSWITYLPMNDAIKSEVYGCLRENASRFRLLRHTSLLCGELTKNKYIESADEIGAEMGGGILKIKIGLPKELYFGMISDILGRAVRDDGDLMLELQNLQNAKQRYDKIKNAFDIAESGGYGIVTPSREDLVIEEPESYRQGNRFGIKIKASAPSYHIIKADISSEISPIVGDEEQSQTLLEFMKHHYQEDISKIWEYDVFGKTIFDMVNDGLSGKFDRLPDDARCKLRETLSRILNEGSGGLICIIL